jgi:geranylgeranyl reductase
MTNTTHYDIAIVGGGPAGATAARYAAAGGARVLLIEQNRAFDKPCGGGLFLRAFDAMEIPRTLIVQEVRTIEVVSPRQHTVSVPIDAFPLGVVHRRRFDEHRRTMAEAAGAPLQAARARLVPDSAFETPTLEARTRDGEVHRIQAAHLIAADGVNSTIRRTVLKSPPSRVMTYYAKVPDHDTDACQFWFGRDIAPGYYAWVFPHHDGAHIGGIVSDRTAAAHHREAFIQHAGLDPHLRLQHYYIPEWDAEAPMMEGKILFAGDSASLVLPFTYEGIYYAMASGRMAAEAILEGHPEAYPRIWDETYRRKFLFLRRLQRIFLSHDWLSERMVTLYKNPRFQRAVIGYWSGERVPENAWKTAAKVLKALTVYR